MHTPDLASITTLVDLELKRLEDSRREHGWTPWLLLAALGALGWKLANYLSSAPRWHEVGLYWALLVVVGLTLESIVGLLNSGEGPRRPGLRFFPATIYSASRSARVFSALKVGTAAGLLVWLTALDMWIKTGFLLLFGFYVYLAAAHLAVSWTDFPNPVGTPPPPKKSSWAFRLFIWIVHLGLVIFAVKMLWPRLVSSYEVADARIALLAFAIAHLSDLLLRYRVNEPVRQELIHLRRLIGLGEISAEDARQRFIESIYGSELAVLLRPRFERMEQHLLALDPLVTQAEGTLLVAVEGGKPRSEAEIRLKEADAQFDPAETEWLFLDFRVKVFSWIGLTPPDVAARHAGMKARVEAVEKKLTDIRTAVKNLPPIGGSL